MYNDFISFETHLTGLRHLVEMRGGVDNLGWDGFIRNSITGYVSYNNPSPVPGILYWALALT
jgi:hypothetical protein